MTTPVYTYTWQALVNPVTGKTMALVAGGGPTDATATYAAPEAPSANTEAYQLVCTITGQPNGNSVTKAVTVQVFMIGDTNNDRYVNVGDLQALITAWASQAGPPASSTWNPSADLNTDGYVNVGDLQLAGGKLGSVAIELTDSLRTCVTMRVTTALSGR